MNAVQIFQLIEQGLTLLPILISAGVNVEQRVEQLMTIAKGGAAGTLTDADVAKIRAQFDADLDSFNTPIA